MTDLGRVVNEFFFFFSTSVFKLTVKAQHVIDGWIKLTVVMDHDSSEPWCIAESPLNPFIVISYHFPKSQY